jgi:hypothetical protein
MCEPTTIMAGLAVASTAMGVLGQNAAADAQLSGLETQRRNQAEELQTQADQNAGERVKQARRERARMRVAAGEAGAGGQSFEASLANSFGQQNHDLAAIARQSHFNDRASQASYASNVAGVNKPNALTAGLQIAGAGYGGYSQGLQMEANLSRLQIPGAQ